MKQYVTSILLKFALMVFVGMSFTKIISAPMDESNSFPLQNTSHDSCEDAVELECDDTLLNAEFPLPDFKINQLYETCFGDIPDSTFREYWIAIDIPVGSIYYIDAYGVNVGIEVYSGTCDDLQLVKCESSEGENTYTAISPLGTGGYYIRLIASRLPGDDDLQLVLNCQSVGPSCVASIDAVVIDSCVNNEGKVGITVQGTITPAPLMPEVYVEIMTDTDFKILDAFCEGESFEVSTEIEGEEIIHLLIFSGNSEGGCGDTRLGIPLPVSPCLGVEFTLFKGLVSWGSNCSSRIADMKLYDRETEELIQTFSGTLVEGTGELNFEVPVGNYDIYLTLPGNLTKKYIDVEVTQNSGIFYYGTLIPGDVNGDNKINSADWYLLNNYFFMTISPDSPVNYLDFNCDGTINIIDFSILSKHIGYQGDNPPDIGNKLEHTKGE